MSQRSIDDLKARLNRKMSKASEISDASAQNISLDCEELSVHRQDHYISSKRSSIDNGAACGVITTAQLEQLTLATFSVVAAGALLPPTESETISDQHSRKDDNPRSSRHSHNKPSSRQSISQQSQRISSANRSSRNSSRQTSGKLQTPNIGYVNGAVTDDDISDVSI